MLLRQRTALAPARAPASRRQRPNSALAVRAGRAFAPTRHSLTDSTVSNRPRAAAPEQAASDATKRCQPGQCRHTSRAENTSPAPPVRHFLEPRPVTSLRRASPRADGRPQGTGSGYLADFGGPRLTSEQAVLREDLGLSRDAAWQGASGRPCCYSLRQLLSAVPSCLSLPLRAPC